MLTDQEIALKTKEVFLHLLKQFVLTSYRSRGRSLQLKEVEREEELVSFGIILGISQELALFRQATRKYFWHYEQEFDLAQAMEEIVNANELKWIKHLIQSIPNT